MSPSDKDYLEVLSEMESWGSYEITAQPRDLSKLDGIRLLLKDLGNPQENYKIIHIAGTNGKGLSATIISHLLSEQGFAAGCYTSPHLTDIRERITLNGNSVAKSTFTQSASLVLKIARGYKGNPYLSYFDVLTAIAFLTFMTEKMEWVVLETGLGGLADSTNVTTKELCVLTRVGLDHQEVLGNSLQEIAAEKIGITRPDVPVIVAEQDAELKPWLSEQFRKSKVPCYFVDEVFDGYFPDKQLSAESYSKPRMACIQTSLCAMQVLFNGNNSEKQKWLASAKKVKMRGRLDLQQNVFWRKHGKYFKTMLFDGGHNFDALTALVEFLTTNKLVPCTLILGMAADKLDSALRIPLKELCEKADTLIFTPVPSPRSATPEELENFIIECGNFEHSPEIKHSSSAEEALESALLTDEKPVVVAGSFYLVGEIMQILENGNTS
ncbi:MAG: bifunctional folylpolyglutamate synthase/ dihydrofolate synthase [Deltaproteobacteria bacterium]|nr:bifunctional folylpolyglutamate synthase/ dihydrofolate synthase [Deltaproteobacteria bacterium]